MENAISILNASKEAPLTREVLVAFCTLEAFKHHFPRRGGDRVARLCDQFQWVRAAEPSRFVKQRRLALGKIMAEMEILSAAPPKSPIYANALDCEIG